MSARSPGERTGYPLHYSWASLVAQTVKKLPAMQETWVQSLSREDLLEEEVEIHSSVLAWRIPMDRGAWRVTVHEVAESDTTERLSIAQYRLLGGWNPHSKTLRDFLCIRSEESTLFGKDDEAVLFSCSVRREGFPLCGHMFPLVVLHPWLGHHFHSWTHLGGCRHIFPQWDRGSFCL